MVGKKFNLIHAGGHFAGFTHLPHMSQHTIDGRGADGALLHRQKLIGAHLVIADGEIRRGAHFQPRAIAVAPRLAGMRDDLAFPLQLAIAQQRFFQDGAFVFQLRGIACMLIVAAAASAEIWAGRSNSVGRRLNDLVDGGAGEAALFLDDRRAHFFRRQHKWREDRLAFRKPGEAVAAIHEFFDCQVHK